MSTTSGYTPPLTDNDIMPFGKHKGKAMCNVPAAYLLWLLNDGCTHQGVKKYILANEQAINNEVSKQPRR